DGRAISGEFKPGGSEAQNPRAIKFAPGALGLSRDTTGGYSAALCLCIGMELLAAAIIMMRRRSTRLVAGQMCGRESATNAAFRAAKVNRQAGRKGAIVGRSG